MLDYAECRFVLYGESDAKAWEQINTLRNRAFGKLEDGKEKALTDKYLPYYNQFAAWTERKADPTSSNPSDRIFQVTRDEYPIPFGSYVDKIADAKEYYTKVKADKGFTSPVWKVAVNMERRKEFNCEWSLRPDMQRSGFMEDHVQHNYPKRDVADLQDVPWTNRTYDYNGLKMDMPIPYEEIINNPDCDHNPAYIK